MFLPGQKAAVLFQKLLVNVVEDSSGIFIGTNQAIGWSSYGKTNQGFGSMSGSMLTNAVNAVCDPDLIDAHTHEVRNIRIAEAADGVRETGVGFQSVQANAVTTGSVIGLGHNDQPGWRSSRKNNYGTGKLMGGNGLRQIVNVTFDNDGVDMPVLSEGGILDTSGAPKNIRIVQNTEAP